MAEKPKKKKKKIGPATKYAPAKEHIVDRQTIKRIWKIRPAQDWLELLKEIAPHQHWKLKGQTAIEGKCPYHNDSTPSFLLSFDRGMGKCFGSGCEKVVGDITSLVAKLKNVSYTEALMTIYNRFNMGDALEASVEEFTQYNRVQEMKKAVAVGMSKIMDLLVKGEAQAYLDYCQPALAYLINVRELPDGILPRLPVGIWVKPVHMKEYIPTNLEAVYDEYFSKVLHDSFYGSLCFYYNDSPGSISRFKLRHLDVKVLEKAESPDKFGDLPIETQAALFSKSESHYVEDPYSSELGVYGMFNYQALIGKKDTNAYVTEGEFDVLTPMAAQHKTGEIDFMLFGAGGKGSTDLQFLREYGVRNVWLVGDHPIKQGDGWVEAILQNKNNFVGTAGMTPLQFRVFQWPLHLKAEDLDDAVKKHGYEAVRDILFIDRNAHFLNSVSWVKKIVDAKLNTLDDEKKRTLTLLESEGDEKITEVSNIEQEYKAELEQHILKGFRLVHSPTDKQEYVRAFISERGIDISMLENVHSAMYALDTVQGVVDRVTENLKEYFELAYYIRRSGDYTLYAWSKKNEELIEIPIAERPLFKTIALFTNYETEQWFDSMLGFNPIYYDGLDEDDKSLSASRKKKANAKYIIEKAFDQQMPRVQNYDSLTVLSQGIHHLDLPANLRQENGLYFVNGPAVYRGTFSPDGADLDWSRVHNAVDRGVVFEDLNRSHIWSSVEGTADLFDASAVDTRALYQDIRKILDGWVFDNHEVTAEYLAAYILSLPMMRAMSDINITLLTGDKISGKTTFSAGLLGGSGSKRNVCPYILESVFQVDNATLPAIYQSTEGKSHLVVFDEAEHGDRYNTLYDDVLDALRRLVHSMPHGGVVVRRGGKTKEETKQYFLRWPLLMAAIHPPSDTTFLTRTIEVRTKRQANHLPIEEYIDNNFSMAKIHSMRKHITTALLPHLPKLMELRRDLRFSLQRIGRAEATVSNRFLDNVVTPLAVYKLIGGDPAKLYAGMIRHDKNKLEAIHSNDPQNDLLNSCLYTKCIRTSVGGDKIVDDVSAQQLLATKEYHVLNNSNSGVYYVPQMQVVVIVWRQAKFGALARTPYANWEVSMLRETAHKTDTAVLDITPSQHKDICQMLNLQDVHSTNGYSVIEIQYLMPNLNIGNGPDAEVRSIDDYKKDRGRDREKVKETSNAKEHTREQAGETAEQESAAEATAGAAGAKKARRSKKEENTKDNTTESFVL